MRTASRRLAEFGVLVNKTLVRPPLCVQIQCDGSFNPKTDISRTALILTNSEGTKYTYIRTYFNHENSMESEWASITDSLEYALQKKHKSAALENDCQPVINSIINRVPPKNPLFLQYYKHFDYVIHCYFDWFALRWIPRGLNKADDLFRI